MKKRKQKKISKAEEKALKVTINGKEETVYEQETPKTEQEKNMTFSNWEEKRKAEQEVAASHEHPDEDEFNWESEEDKVFKDDPKVVPPYQKKKSKLYSKGKTGAAKPVKRVAATIAFAAVLGTGLGLFALNISGNKEASAPASLDDSLGSQTAKAGDTAEEKQSTAGEKQAAQTEGTYKTYAVQAGKFSNEKGAETLTEQLTEKGYSAVSLSKDDGYTYVIAGLASDKAVAQQVGQLLIDNDFEAWGGKELSLSIESDMTGPFKKTAELSVKAILGEDITKASVEKIKNSLGKTEAAETGEKKAILQALKELEDPSAEAGWKAQQQLLAVIK
ncbi:SPOR domain-containing protein [Bacillus mojavensis]|uniref:SPOR domain-containing protein n=1 Tax=Bacillus mojavensis TaxID=72360 RepID=UPI002DBF6535|nr:SPOR domain-containing protein [Bacillus mojavensis]MEC1289911.1 SPOR domain-containing protein [Bacillus mojavensis]MEC1702835.1 SPOR domain-containing protein [Bacillus mojavensis]MEC5248102.1 SPOR domain-containing protein [Bacillus mojavensis]